MIKPGRPWFVVLLTAGAVAIVSNELGGDWRLVAVLLGFVIMLASVAIAPKPALDNSEIFVSAPQ